MKPSIPRQITRAVVGLVAWLAGVALVAAPAVDDLCAPEIKRVVFRGDSTICSGRYLAYVSAYQRARFPTGPVEILNLRLSSETVSGLSKPGHAGGKLTRPDLHEQLARLLNKTKPDLVFGCDGMNDGIRTERWSCIHWLPPNPEVEERYDLSRDQLEGKNVAAAPHYAGTLAELRTRWEKYHSELK